MMYICTQVTSLHLSFLDTKRLVTFKIVLFSLSLGFDQSSVANERILTVKVMIESGLWNIIIGSFTELLWTKEEVVDDKTVV